MAACQRLGHEAEYRGRVEAGDEDAKGDFGGDGPADHVVAGGRDHRDYLSTDAALAPSL